MELCSNVMLYRRGGSSGLVVIIGSCVEGMMCVGLLLRVRRDDYWSSHDNILTSDIYSSM